MLSFPYLAIEDPGEAARLREELRAYEKKHAELLGRFDTLAETLKTQKIETFEDLAKQDEGAKRVLVQLANKTEAVPMQGKNIGLFGLTSTGKSTMLNTMLGGKPVAETGSGETTLEIKRYPAEHYALWDVPGRNDEIAYLSMEYIAFFKGLSQRFVLIQATVKENSSMMKLLDEIGLRYDIVFNKFDNVDEDERLNVQQQIRKEIKDLGLTGVEGVYFVSAKKPQMFPDWLKLVHHLTD